MATYEILIADDHPLFRSALHQALTLGLGPDVRLVEVASIAELETRLTEKADWDLVLLDLNMPGLGGAGTLPRLRAGHPDLPVLLATGRADQSAMDLVAHTTKTVLLPKPFSSVEITSHFRQLGLT